MAEVTEADKALWETLGPAIFHGDMTGPETLSTVREAAEKAERQAVVDWLNAENSLCDCFARDAYECGCGAWDDRKTKPLSDIAEAIERGDHRKG